MFNQLVPVALVYSAIANLGNLLAKPFLPQKSLHAPLLPEDTFRTSGGEVAIVTGSNAGIGFETASALVNRGYDVILACRSRDKGERAAKKLNDLSHSLGGCQPGKALFLHPLDLSSFGSVRTFVTAFKSKYSTCNILVNNAGINSTGKSVDGHDLCFQTNFMGHFLLTRLLMPCLLKAENHVNCDGGDGVEQEAGRVVNLSSVTHHFVRADETRNGVKEGKGRSSNHDEEFWRGCAAVGVSDNTYRESKLASVLFTLMLNDKFGKDGLKAVTANPGSVNSDIWRNYPKFVVKVFRLIYLTSRQGSQTSVAAAVGNVPRGVYLQPYWQPRKSTSRRDHHPVSFSRSFGLPFPAFEMLGLFIGHAITEARLPDDGKDGLVSASAMWKVCSEIVELP